MRTSSRTRQNAVSGLDELFDYVRKKHDQGFWGEVMVKFKNGVPYLIKEIKQIKLSSDNDT